MPLYEYQCDACGHRFEAIQKFSDPPLESCPKCGGAVQKLQSAPAFQFKGSGWYITDYARKHAGGAEKADGAKAESKETGGSGEKSETKSQPKSESKADAAPAAKAGKA